MSVGLDLLELVAYSDYERTKWKAWIAARPARLALTYQTGNRFPTLGALFDHLFLVERRHLSRLEGAQPPAGTGIVEGDWRALFEYGDLVRADLRHYIEGMDAAEAEQILTWAVPSGGPFPAGSYSLSRKHLTTHILLHEIRHLAQAASIARLTGDEPPGEHDFFYFVQHHAGSK